MILNIYRNIQRECNPFSGAVELFGLTSRPLSLFIMVQANYHAAVDTLYTMDSAEFFRRGMQFRHQPA